MKKKGQMRLLATVILGMLMLISAGCKEDRQTAPASTSAEVLPLLAPGQHLGMITGFNPNQPAATADSTEARRAEARAAGMTVGRVQIDWPELEPAEGQYDEAALRDQLRELSEKGLQPFLTLPAYDSDGLVLPAYLAGKNIDDPELISRFKALMDWVIPMLKSEDGWGITIANEPDNFFAESPELAARIYTFLTETRHHIHVQSPEMAVTVTLNIGNMAASRTEMEVLRTGMDVVCFNLYGSGLFPIDQPYTAAEIQAEMDAVLDFAEGKAVIFQEIGMHSNTDLLNSSEDIQAAFFDTFFARMQQEPLLRAAFIFQLVDWSPEAIAVFNTTFEEDVPQSFIDQYSAVLCSIGLIRYEDGQQKAAWGRVLYWLEVLRE